MTTLPRSVLLKARKTRWWPARGATCVLDSAGRPIAQTREQRPSVAHMATEDLACGSRTVLIEVKAGVTTSERWSEARLVHVEEFLVEDAEFFGYRLEVVRQTDGTPRLSTPFRWRLRYVARTVIREALHRERAAVR